MRHMKKLLSCHLLLALCLPVKCQPIIMQCNIIISFKEIVIKCVLVQMCSSVFLQIIDRYRGYEVRHDSQ